MFGMIGKIRAAAGKRAELVALLSENAQTMPGCRHYIVMEDQSDPDGVWITEVWDTQASHTASLQLESVRAAIAKARPIIAGFDISVKTNPVAGV